MATEELECGICMCKACEPISFAQCERMHVLCLECAVQYYQHKSKDNIMGMADASKCPTCRKAFFNIILLKFPSQGMNSSDQLGGEGEKEKEKEKKRPFQEMQEHLRHLSKRFPLTSGDHSTTMIDLVQFALFVNNRDAVRERIRIEKALASATKFDVNSELYRSFLELDIRFPYRNMYNRVIPSPAVLPDTYGTTRCALYPSFLYNLGSFPTSAASAPMGSVGYMDLMSQYDMEEHELELGTFPDEMPPPVGEFSYNGVRDMSNLSFYSQHL